MDDNAHTMTLWLKPLQLGFVHPVLMLWGSNGRDLPASLDLLAGDRAVTVVAGPMAKDWLHSLPAHGLTPDQTTQAWSALDEQCRKRDAHDGDDIAVPLSLAEIGMRAIFAVLAGSASFFLAATWLKTSPSAWLWLPALVVLVAPALALWRLEARTRYLVWGWLFGVGVTVVLLGWAIGRWFVDNRL